jgi:hypothetical protein
MEKESKTEKLAASDKKAPRRERKSGLGRVRSDSLKGASREEERPENY